MKIEKANGLKGTVAVPGDKSISHRAVLIGSIAEGDTKVRHFLPSADCLASIACMKKLGVEIEETKEEPEASSSSVVIRGRGLKGLHAADGVLDCANSGTTARLLSGLLAGQEFTSHLTGDASLTSRPMKRIMTPLAKMGARVISEKDNGCAPLTVSGGHLKGIAYQSPVASAQVKSCVLLAGLYAEGMTTVIEPAVSRNHTELMLSRFGADIAYDLFDPAKLDMKGMDGVPIVPGVVLRPGQKLAGQTVDVPGDISSAAYFLAAGLLVPHSEIVLKNVGINPTRDGILRVIAGMGGYVEISNEHREGNELAADLVVSSSSLRGAEISGGIIPTLIDEIPMIAVMAAFSAGDTVIRDAAELKVKETDRLSLIAENLKNMGADLEVLDDGMIIHGGKELHGTIVDPQGDHRIAMAFAVAGLLTGGMEIKNADCVDVSYPGFFRDLAKLQSCS